MKKLLSYYFKQLSILGLGMLTLIACSGVETVVDYDEEVDFSPYDTFGFYDNMEPGLDSLDIRRINAVLVDELEEKDYSINQEKADLLINYYADTYETENRHNIGIGIGTIGRSVSGNISSGIPLKSHNQYLTLTVELINATNGQLYWQGVVEQKLKPNLKPEERKAFFQKALHKLLKNYPPE